jgi:hypothetical protein
MVKKITTKKIPPVPTTALQTTLPNELQITDENREAILATCKKVDLTREKCLVAIKEGLTATKVTLDKYGEEHEEIDHDKRLKAALMGLEVLGDVRNKATTVDSSRHTHVTYAWLSGPVPTNVRDI